MVSRSAFFWKKAPFIRLFIPFATGIVIQWYGQLPWYLWLIPYITSSGFLISFFNISYFRRYRFAFLNGISVFMFFLSTGALLTWWKDIRNDNQWLGNHYQQGAAIIATLEEPLTEKTKSFKAQATVNFIIQNKQITSVKGNIILYFKKDSLPYNIDYGTQVVFRKSLQEIKNSGNPGGFDYKRYCLFQGITHQVFLQQDEFEILSHTKSTFYQRLLFPTQQKILSLIRKYIPGNKETGLAEALLIGYKNDLDKTLVQSYSNTGVVHIIAISGMHIGLIYWLLMLLLKPLQRIKLGRWLQPILVIAGLWAFSLLAGGQASVLRSAVMFTCIVLGQAFLRKSSVYNTLAFSAFILLCYNPYWLWDAGFQLSYAAVLSIMIFMKPIYNWFYIKNKILDFIWQLNAVTLAAQILTLPFTLYHFHQFPVYFLLTNFVAVPLSSIIVLGEILLCVVSVIPSAALLVGKILSWLISLMNSYIQIVEDLPGSLVDGLQINIVQAIAITIFITGIGFWLIERIKRGLTIAAGALLVFASLLTYSSINAFNQQKIIVYNIPQHKAIDFIQGNRYLFAGDSDLFRDDFTRNFHLKPSRTNNRMSAVRSLNQLIMNNNFISYGRKRILWIDSAITFAEVEKKHQIDLLIISKNPVLYMPRLAKTFSIREVVFDGSASFRKLKYWKKDCDSLHIPWHDVSEKGAFVMTLN
jgi:competence protein ComEC